MRLQDYTSPQVVFALIFPIIMMNVACAVGEWCWKSCSLGKCMRCTRDFRIGRLFLRLQRIPNSYDDKYISIWIRRI
jgi:hypothetical protein